MLSVFLNHPRKNCLRWNDAALGFLFSLYTDWVLKIKRWITAWTKGVYIATCRSLTLYGDLTLNHLQICAFNPSFFWTSSKRITFMKIYKTFYFNELGWERKRMTSKEFLSWDCQEWFRLSCFFPVVEWERCALMPAENRPRLTSFVSSVSLKHVHGKFCGSRHFIRKFFFSERKHQQHRFNQRLLKT